MNKKYLLKIVAVSVTFTLLAVGTFMPAIAGTLVEDSFESVVLGRTYPMQIYLPDNYNEMSDPLSVVYLLHGASGDQFDWPNKGGVQTTLDALIKRGEMRPSVVVMPGNGPSWWVDGVVDKAETAFINELIPYVEDKYPVAISRTDRTIGGLSMGGYAALNLSLRYPDKFCAAAVISPAIYDPVPPLSSAARRTAQFVRNGEFDEELWKKLLYTSHLDEYQKTGKPVSMWIVSGDHDRLGIAAASAQLFWKLHQFQPKQVELRVVDGDHDWMVFRDGLPDALRYADSQCAAQNK
jgi:enterochelin esterase-like enzyme